MTGAALVLSVVDGRTGVVHLVAVEKVALHRRSGRYPTLCDNEVISASLMTEPAQECRYCLSRAQAGAGADRQREPAGRRRPRLSWPAVHGVRVLARRKAGSEGAVVRAPTETSVKGVG